MKKPALLVIKETDMHWFKPSFGSRLALRIKGVKRFLSKVGKILGFASKVLAMPILAGFIYMASIHHPVNVSQKIPVYNLDQQIDRCQAISWLNK